MRSGSIDLGAAGGNVEATIHRVCTQPPAQERYESRAERTAYHQAKLARYRKLYDLTKALHQD
jgi:xylulokinase